MFVVTEADAAAIRAAVTMPDQAGPRGRRPRPWQPMPEVVDGD
jgi:hypothetical protein